MNIEKTFTKNIKFTNLARRARNGIIGAYMLGAGTLGFGLGQSATAKAEVIDPQNFSTPTSEVATLMAPEYSPRQTINLTLDTTLPVPYEGETDLTNGWYMEVAPVDAEGNYLTLEQLLANDSRLDNMFVRIGDTNSSYKEIRKVIQNTGDETDVYHFTVPDLLISGPGFSNRDALDGAKGHAFFGGDGSNIGIRPPTFPRSLIFPTSNETTFNETARTQAIVDEANRIPAGYENSPRVTGVSTMNLEFITGAYNWSDFHNDLNVSGMLWLAPGELGAPARWDFGLMRADRSTATVNALRNEVEAFRGLIANIRPSGEISDGENLARRLGDSIIREADFNVGDAVITGFYNPNSSDGSGKAPGDLPPYVVLRDPLSGPITEGQLQMLGVVATEQMPMGSVKALYR